MRKAIVLLSLLGIVIAACNAAPANQSPIAACFPGLTQDQVKAQIATLEAVRDIQNDDFGALAILGHSYMKCDADTAFIVWWELYLSSSKSMKHPIIDKDQARAAFNRNW